MELEQRNASLQHNLSLLGLGKSTPKANERNRKSSLTQLIGLASGPKLDQHDVRASRAAKQNRAKEMHETGCIIDPRYSRFTPKWDMIMLLALFYTALVTPVEVAFYDTDQYITGLFVVNRLVDLCFTVDIILTFHLAIQRGIDLGGYWVLNKKTIAVHYLKGWLFLDVMSVLPFWMLTLRWSDPFNRLGKDVDSEANLARTAVLFRVIKLLRMLKLARIFKASRVIQRSLLDFVMNQWEWTFAVLKMLKLFGILTFYAHWQACVWGLLSSYMNDDGYPNWIADFHASYSSIHEGVEPTGIEVYGAALYWSVMTLTSIGYGEMTPVNSAERFLCSLYMLLSGVMWTYAIGSVAAIASTLDPNGIEYHNTMDALNYFMRERELPKTLRMTLRDYFSSARRVHQLNDDGYLLDKMSPLLQGIVALSANKKWLEHVWYFKDIESVLNGSEFVVALAKQLVIRSYVAHERLPTGQLYILRAGFVVRMWRFLGVGKVFGEDMILSNKNLIDHAQAVALTYVEAYTLRKTDLDQVLAEYPAAQERVRRAALKITLQRALLAQMAEINGKSGPRSVALRRHAKGYVEVHDTHSLQQKVDQMYGVVVETNSVIAAKKAFGKFDNRSNTPSPSPGRGGGGDGSGGGGGGGVSPAQHSALEAKVDALASQMQALLKVQTEMAQALKQLPAEIRSGMATAQ